MVRGRGSRQRRADGDGERRERGRDRLQYAKTFLHTASDQKLELGKGLGTRLGKRRAAKESSPKAYSFMSSMKSQVENMISID